MWYADEYGENTPVVIYGTGKEFDGAPVFYRVCPKCGRFVKPDDRTKIPEYLGKEPNATCKKCGRVQMPFALWYFDDEDEDASDYIV
jgi:uncharacterized OB-fold protein